MEKKGKKLSKVYSIISDDSIFTIAVTKNKTIISGSETGTIKVFDFESKKITCVFKNAHVDRVNSIAIAPNQNIIATAGNDSSIKLFNISEKLELYNIQKAHAKSVWAISITPDEKYIISGSKDCTIKIFNYETRKEAQCFNSAHQQTVRTLAITPDGKQIVSGSWDKSIKIWDIEKRKESYQFKEAHFDNINIVAISPDGKYIVSGSNDKSIKVFDINSHKEIMHFKNAHLGNVYALAVTPEGKQIVSGSNDYSIKLFDIDLQTEVDYIPNAHKDFINSIAVSPKGKFIITGSNDKAINIYTINSPKTMNVQAPIPNVPIVAKMWSNSWEEWKEVKTEHQQPVFPVPIAKLKSASSIEKLNREEELKKENDSLKRTIEKIVHENTLEREKWINEKNKQEQEKRKIEFLLEKSENKELEKMKITLYVLGKAQKHENEILSHFKETSVQISEPNEINFENAKIEKIDLETTHHQIYVGTQKNMKVGVKILEICLENFDSFLSEIMLSMQTSHQNIVKIQSLVFDKFNFNGQKLNRIRTFIIMELMKIDISKIIRSIVGIQIQTKVSILREILKGLCFLHEQNLVHCNLKPTNVLLDTDITDPNNQKNKPLFAVKLSDMGISKIDKTKQSLFGATTKYSPLEYLVDKNLTTKCDIWGFGIITYELFSGKMVWEGMDDIQIVANLARKTQFFAVHQKLNDPILDKIIEDCLLFDFKARPSAKDLIERIEKIA